MSSIWDELGRHTTEITPEEAMLLDYVLTLHDFNEPQLDWLMKADILNWREQAGRIILGKEKTISLSDDDLKVLLAIVPITHRFGQLDVGWSLKTKLYKAYLSLEEERKDASNNETKSDTKDEAQGSTGTLSSSFPA